MPTLIEQTVEFLKLKPSYLKEAEEGKVDDLAKEAPVVPAGGTAIDVATNGDTGVDGQQLNKDGTETADTPPPEDSVESMVAEAMKRFGL